MNPRAIGLNKRNGKILSEDVGLMQINSSWYITLSRMGITRKDLLENPCQNIHVGAWMLKTSQQMELIGSQLALTMQDLRMRMLLFA